MNNITFILNALNLSAEELARELGCGKVNIYNWQKGVHVPTASSLLSLKLYYLIRCTKIPKDKLLPVSRALPDDLNTFWGDCLNDCDTGYIPQQTETQAKRQGDIPEPS